jgi:WD40 repeat protein
MSDDRVRIFVSSPSDVERERSAVKDIVERLAAEYLPYFTLQAILWEEEALTADRTFQAGLTQPAECEIVLVIVWTRLGSPLPEDPYRGMTGTEWEFVNAVEASTHTGTPEVLVYKKNAPKLVDITDTASAREAVEDQRRLSEFFRSHFFNEDNTFKRAFRTFDNDAAFRELLEVQLRKLLNRRISAERRATAGALQWHGSPFRAERPFEIGDERVFTGREGEIRDLLARMENADGRHRGFLLLSGASGSGKTSLLRAGLVPRLTRPFLFEHIATVRCALVEPDTGGPAPLEVLAARLCAGDVLGDALARFGLGPDELERLLAADPRVAARQLASALALVAQANESDAQARLAIIVDPLDRLFDGREAAAVDCFARALQGLAANDAIWVIAAVRGDALYRLAGIPALREMLDHDTWRELPPPAPARIRQVVEIPARVAGIELDTGEGEGAHGIVAEIEAEAGALRLWPPAVQGVLDAAFTEAADKHREHDEVRLTVEHYRAVGGISGHVLRRAGELWEELSSEQRAALPRLCRALVGTDGGSSKLVPRNGDLRVLRGDPACEALVERLIEARLVVAEGIRDPSLLKTCEAPQHRLSDLLRGLWRQGRDEWQARLLRLRILRGPRSASADTTDPKSAAPANAEPPSPGDEADLDWREFQPVAGFIHPILIERWQPVSEWVAQPENRRLLQLRSQLTRQAQLWKRTDCNREYLYREVGYAQALDLMEAAGDELEDLEREFLEQSAANLRFVRRRNRLVRLTGLILLSLLAVATIAAWLALNASQEARINLHRSKLKEADIFIGRGNTPQAVANAIDAGRDLPQQAVQTLSNAFSSNRLLAMEHTRGPALDQPYRPGFSADGSLLATIDATRGPVLWRLARGRFALEHELDGDALGLHTLIIGDDDQVFGIGRDGIWRLPAADDAPALYPCGSAPGAVYALDPERRLLAVARDLGGDRQSVCVVDLALPGRVLLDLELREGEIRGLSFSPDSTVLLSASAAGRTHAIDLQRSAIRFSLPSDGPLGRPFNNAVFDAAGEHIAIAAVDERVRLYRGDGTPIAALAESKIGGRSFKIHRTAVRDVAFAPGGDFLVAVDDEGQVVRWSLDGDRQAVVLGNHSLSVGQVAIGPGDHPGLSDEHLVLTASLDRTARLWGLETGKQAAVLGHDGAVSTARFSRDGGRVLTFSERDGSVRLWSVDPVSRLGFKLAHPDHVWDLDTTAAPDPVAPDGDALLLATAGFDGGVRVWRYERSADKPVPEPMTDFRQHDARVRQVRFSASGELLASAGYDGRVNVNGMISGSHCELQLAGSDGGNQVYNALFGPDADWLVTTSNDTRRPVRVFSPSRCAPIDAGAALAHGGAEVEAAAVGDLGAGAAAVVTGDENGTLRVLHADAAGAWRQACVLEVGIGPIVDVDISADGRLIGAAGDQNRAAVVEVTADGPCSVRAYLEGHSGRVYSIALSPDARQVLTASLDKSARVWDLDGNPQAVLLGHQDRIYRAAFSPGDGRWMLTASRDGTIRVWQTPRPQTPGAPAARPSAFLPLRADLGGVATADFSPDGHYIAGAYWENAAVLWRIWAEDHDLAQDLAERWGPDRARLALIGEAYRFRADNPVTSGDAQAQETQE